MCLCVFFGFEDECGGVFVYDEVVVVDCVGM